MKVSNIRDMRTDERAEKLDGLKKQLFSLRSQSVTEKMENTNAVKNVKRDIARIKTIMRENELKGL
jgi:large subunit ribosomal protein L29